MVVTNPKNYKLPGIKEFRNVFYMLGDNVVLVDRTNTIQVPVRTKIYSPLPEYQKFTTSYEDICDIRAKELLEKSDAQNLPIYIFYSGGIDSTLVLVSFLKNSTTEQLKRITLLMSHDSISENPNFYENYIRGKLNLKSAAYFPYLLNKQAMFVGGEYNDQIFGSALFKDFIDTFSEKTLLSKYQRDLMTKMFLKKWHSPKVVSWYMDLFESVYKKAECPTYSNADFLWWLNFTFKWQSVYFRMLTYAADHIVQHIDNSFIKNNFFHFFGTDEFQLWSMNNPDKKIKNTWESYKFEAKEVIYKFNKDNHYRLYKTKHGSLAWVIMHQIQKNFISDKMQMYSELNADVWYQPNNSFIDAPTNG